MFRITAAAAALALAALPARADELDLGDVDKQAHIAVSYGLCLTGAALGQRYGLERWQAVALAATLTFAIGLGKEVVDDDFSGADLAADGIGIGAAAAVVFAFEL